MKGLLNIIHYFQTKIQRANNDEKVLIDSIVTVSKLPVTAEHLQKTRIYDIMHTLSLKGGAVGTLALPIYNKWRHLKNVALKDKDSPIKSPDQPRSDERPRSTPVLTSNHASRSSTESNASNSSRDNNHSSRSMKYSDPSQYGRRDMDRDARCSGGSFNDVNGMGSRDNRCSGSSSSEFNGIGNSREHRRSGGSSKEYGREAGCSSSETNGLGNRDSYHLYEDGSYNPHLDIDISDRMGSGSEEAVDQNGGAKGRIPEPYAIEMREGMFRVVKCKDTSAIPPSILRTRQLYYKEFLQKSVPYKKERDPSERPRHRESPVKRESSPSKSSSHHSNGERSSKMRKVESTTVEKHDSDKASRPKTSSEGRHLTLPGKSNSVSPTNGDEAKDRKRQERKSTPDAVPDKSKIKAAMEERASHVSKSSNADNLQTNCDRKPVKLIDSPDDSAKYISSKKDRRAVYSGKKLFPTLQELCCRSLKKHVDLLKSTRSVPYNVLKPFLERLNPTQLARIEEQNKYLLKDTDELWKQHCTKDHRKQVPSKNETWRIIYQRALKEQDIKLKSIAAHISASSMKVRPDRQTKITLVDSLHDPQRKRMKRSNSPILPPNSSSPLVNSRLSPHVSVKVSPNVNVMSKTSPSVSSKSVSPNVSIKLECSKPSSSKESRPHPKQPRKADAPLMSKLKKSMGLAYRSK